MTSIRIEAEKMTLTNYRIESASKYTFASGKAFTSLSRGDTNETGIASTLFSGPSGQYDIVVAFFDENDGISHLKVQKEDILLDQWDLDRDFGSDNVGAQTLDTRTIPRITLNPGDKIEIIGTENQSEFARVDYIEFIPIIPAISPILTASLTANLVTTSGEDKYQFTVTYTDETGIDIATIDSNDILVTGPNNFEQLATLVTLDTNSNSPSLTAIYEIASPGSSWENNDNGTYTISLQPNQVANTSNHFVISGSLGNFDVNVPSPSPVLGMASYASATRGVLVNLEKGLSFISKFNGPLKVMPMGDSITYGVVAHPNNITSGGYRTFLWNEFQELGLATDFVGSSSTPNGGAPDDDHNGYRGKTINWLTSDKWTSVSSGDPAGPSGGLTQSLNEQKPDVILLMAGTNDSQKDSVQTMLNDLSKLIDKIAQISPQTELLVAELPPSLPEASGGVTRQQKIADFNAALPGLVSNKVTEGKKVSFVPMGLTIADISSPTIDNGLHPNLGGYEKIADGFYDAVLNQAGQKESLSGVTQVIGSVFADTLIGDSNDNSIEGGDGDDLITGGGGSDRLVYRSLTDGVDTITDFGSDDRFEISASGFGGGLIAGVSLSTTVSPAGRFVSGVNPMAQESGAHFLYETLTGMLSFDPDGVGSSESLLMAILKGAPHLMASQFTMV